MGHVAAFFDLDRTVLRGASGPAINEALSETGLRSANIPGEALLYRIYNLFGENLLGMALARAAAFGVKGWRVDEMEKAGEVAAGRLEALVGRYTRPLLDEHRRNGHLLVLATTTPEVLVRPLAERLGFDDVLATRYGEENGRFTGRIVGRFVWGPGKLSTVREWAGERGVELRESYAYSDSIYDYPLLSAVGHAAAVNPDPALIPVAVLRRWPVLHLDVPPGVPTVGGVEPYDVARLLVRPELFPYARFDIEGVENIPREGPFILAANHRSYFDVAALALAVAKSGRPARFLGKRELFDAPVIGQIGRAFGGIPVDRAGKAANALRDAERVLAAGEGLIILPQGTIPRGPAFFDPELAGKTGVARLAAASGAPVIPLGLWNTESVWPRSSQIPRVLNLFSPPTVRVRVGPPVKRLGLGSGDVVRDTKAIMRAIAALLPAEARERREPTESELDRTYPKGRRGEERSLGVEPAS
jgi:putative phosphoserine phosphatase / 1-acylglycerol-3-phosphate O-acyltransferase